MVYLLQAEGTNYYKIGYTSSDDVNTRIKGLQTGSPHKIRSVWNIPDGTVELERKLHSDYESNRGSGEWFEFDSEEIQGVLAEFVKRAECGSDEAQYSEKPPTDLYFSTFSFLFSNEYMPFIGAIPLKILLLIITTECYDKRDDTDTMYSVKALADEVGITLEVFYSNIEELKRMEILFEDENANTGYKILPLGKSLDKHLNSFNHFPLSPNQKKIARSRK